MPDRLVTIARFRDLPEALIQIGKLESAGIDAELRDDNLIRMNWTLSNAVGGVQLVVAEQDRAEALAILESPTDPTLDVQMNDGVEAFQQPRCPRCGSLNIENRPGNRGLTYFALFAGPVPIPLGKGEWHCSDCDALWEVVPDDGSAEYNANADGNEDLAPSLYAATTNKGKLQEFCDIAALDGVEVLPVPHQDKIPEVHEDGDTFEANATKKALEYSRHLPGQIVFADDSGLEVTALGGAPGVYSARYAARSQDHKPSDSDNNYKLLAELRDAASDDRSARFVCVLAAARDGHLLGLFRGEAHGEILASPLGKHGFGYDPLFFVVEADKTFAEMNAREKSKYSHRGAAFRNFLDWLQQREQA